MQAFYTDRSDRGRLRVTGRDRQTFLQGMVSNDVARLTPGQGVYTFILDATGHVLSDARVLCLADSLLLDVEPGQAEFVKETLEKYLIMERCRIEALPPNLGQITVWGPDATELLSLVLGGSDWANAVDDTNRVAAAHGDTLIVATTPLLSVPVYDLYMVSLDYRDGFYRALLEDAGAREADEAALDTYRIEAGIPRFGVDIDARTLAPETAQAARAISFKKGCYIGQEIVARIDARGHTNRTFVGFYLTQGEPLPEKDTALVADDGREVGRITSSAVGPTVHWPIALGYVRREHAEPGTRLRLIDTETAVEVAALPFAGTV